MDGRPVHIVGRSARFSAGGSAGGPVELSVSTFPNPIFKNCCGGFGKVTTGTFSDSPNKQFMFISMV